MDNPDASSSLIVSQARQVGWETHDLQTDTFSGQTVAYYTDQGQEQATIGQPFFGVDTPNAPMSVNEQTARSRFVNGCTDTGRYRMLSVHNAGLKRVATALWLDAVLAAEKECLSAQTDLCVRSVLISKPVPGTTHSIRLDICYDLFDTREDKYLTPDPVALASINCEVHDLEGSTVWKSPPHLVGSGDPTTIEEYHGFAPFFVPISASRPDTSSGERDIELTNLLFNR